MDKDPNSGIQYAIQGNILDTSTSGEDKIILEDMESTFKNKVEELFTISLVTMTGDEISLPTAYLYDKETGITTNLNESDYQFRSYMNTYDRRSTVLLETKEEGSLAMEDLSI